MSEYLKTDLESILNHIDLLISKKQPEEIEANLYSARMHVRRAITEAYRLQEAA